MVIEMKTIILFHTIKTTLNFFDRSIKKQIREPINIVNMLDEGFAAVDREKTKQEIKNWRYKRLFSQLKSVESDSDIIVVACSTLSLEVQQLKQLFSIPVLAIDDSLLTAVVNEQKPITLFATSPNPIDPILDRLGELSGGHKKIDYIMLCEEALPYLLSNHMEKFKVEVLKFFSKNKPATELLLLAQGSSAVLTEEISELTGCTVLTSIDYCINDIKRLLR
jgi:hypothetical protein